MEELRKKKAAIQEMHRLLGRDKLRGNQTSLKGESSSHQNDMNGSPAVQVSQ